MSTVNLNRRNLAFSLSGVASACLLVMGGNSAAQSAPSPQLQNWALGQPNARVTLIEYASLTCGHCAAFHRDVLTTIKRRYIDTGLVRYIMRPLPTPPVNLAVAMHALTLCAGPSRYYPLVYAFFANQNAIFNAARAETGPKATIFKIANDVGGLNAERAGACLRDPTRQAQIRASAEAGAAAGVQSTPTLFINGELLTVGAGQRLNDTAVITAIEIALRTLPNRRSVGTKAQKR